MIHQDYRGHESKLLLILKHNHYGTNEHQVHQRYTRSDTLL